MLANIITLTRIFLSFGVVTLFRRHIGLDVTLIFTIFSIFMLDAVDGSVARKRNETSEAGALLDTIADSIVENVFWIYFTTIGLIPLWMPVTVMVSGVITDNFQDRCSSEKNGWTDALTNSLISRALYGIVKMLNFLCLASTTIFDIPVLRGASFPLAILTVGFCLLREIRVVGAAYRLIFLTPKTQTR